MNESRSLKQVEIICDYSFFKFNIVFTKFWTTSELTKESLINN